MRRQLTEAETLFAAITEEQGGFAYADGKMTIKEMLGHLIVGERIFSYRALMISYGDQTPLPGFEQDLFIAHGNFNAIGLADLIKEFSNLLQANIIFFQNLTDAAWERTGTVNDNAVSVRALAYNMVNHVRHHLDSLRLNYLT
jgi:hypothetical protein